MAKGPSGAPAGQAGRSLARPAAPRPSPGTAGWPTPAAGLAAARFAEVCPRILPQVVPARLRRVCRRPGAGLCTIPLAGDLAVAFVVDEPDRYCYITAAVAQRWGVGPAQLLGAALANLRRISLGAVWKQIGRGARAFFLCETFDGYDAARVLLGRELAQLAARVAGNPIVGIPHRDFLVVAGDRDLRLVAELQAMVGEDFARAPFPISPRLYAWQDGRLVPYDPEAARPPLWI